MENGAIKAQATKPYSHLFYVGESGEGQFARFKDFVLELVDLAESPVDETKWFKVRLSVHERRIVIEIDGDVVVDYTEPEDVKGERNLFEDGGAIALQAHDPNSVVYYRRIRIKRL